MNMEDEMDPRCWACRNDAHKNCVNKRDRCPCGVCEREAAAAKEKDSRPVTLEDWRTGYLRRAAIEALDGAAELWSLEVRREGDASSDLLGNGERIQVVIEIRGWSL